MAGIPQMKKTNVKKLEKTSEAVDILDRMMGKNPALRRLVEEARINAIVAQLIYDAQNKADLTQEALAKLVGTKQPVIARLEDADYEGHSLTMLQRIAAALNQRIEIHFKPATKAA
jgi:ribosome-binding protein aMBF1 (putative translation factor)